MLFLGNKRLYRSRQSEELGLEAKSTCSGTDVNKQSSHIVNFVSIYKAGLQEHEANGLTLNTSEKLSFYFCFS